MLKRISLSFVLLAVSLGGCDSFTLSYQHEAVPHAPVPPVNTDPSKGVVQTNAADTENSVIQKLTDIQHAQERSQEQAVKEWCPRWRAPILPPPPQAPLARLNQLKPSDTEAINALERDHIVELHQWIMNTQAITSKSYRDYVQKCEALKRAAVKPPNM